MNAEVSTTHMCVISVYNRVVWILFAGLVYCFVNLLDYVNFILGNLQICRMK